MHVHIFESLQREDSNVGDLTVLQSGKLLSREAEAKGSVCVCVCVCVCV